MWLSWLYLDIGNGPMYAKYDIYDILANYKNYDSLMTDEIKKSLSIL